MNIKPEHIPDEVVEAALAGWDEMRGHPREDKCMRVALAAALPVLLVQVGWKCTARPSSEGTQAIQFTHNPESADTFACLGWTVAPVYTLPTQDTPNADQ